MIELKQVSLRAGTFALHEVSFRVEQGEYAILMGRTGRGKTTILEAICGLRPVLKGEILLDGRAVQNLTPGERNIGYVPQDLALFPTMTVRQHLEFALHLRSAAAADIHRRVEELALLLGIQPLLGRLPKGLSGGESQRVAVGRALSFRPSVLLMDEPLSALDETTREEMYSLLKRVQGQTGVTTIHVTHSRSEAQALGDRLLILDDGQVREAAPNTVPLILKPALPVATSQRGDLDAG
jgi:ABC-type sugar transport system ATPase subunit